MTLPTLARRAVPALAALALTLSACQTTSGGAIASRADLVGCPAPASRPLATAATTAAPREAEPTHADVRGQNAALDGAVAAYDEARFDAAAQQFEAVAASGTASLDVRRVALRMLGRTHLALGNAAGASDALRRLVALEPPVVRLDPDVEPLRLMESFYEVRRAADGDYAVRTTRGRTLAIADFTNASISDFQAVDPLRLGFASLMIDRLRGSTSLELVERVRLQWLLDELSLGAGEDAGRQAGSLLGADQVVFGTYIKNSDQMILTARVVDVETGRILLGERVSGPAARFDDLVGCLSEMVAASVDADPPPSDPRASLTSLDAVIAYARGLALEESEDYTGAAAQYQLALRHAPDYAPAQSRLTEGLAPFMVANR